MKRLRQLLMYLLSPAVIVLISLAGTVQADPFVLNIISADDADNLIMAEVVHRGRPPFKRIYPKKDTLEEAEFALLEEVSDKTIERRYSIKKRIPQRKRPPFRRFY